MEDLVEICFTLHRYLFLPRRPYRGSFFIFPSGCLFIVKDKLEVFLCSRAFGGIFYILVKDLLATRRSLLHKKAFQRSLEDFFLQKNV